MQSTPRTLQVFELIKSGEAEELQTFLAEDPAQAAVRNEEGLSACLFALYHRKKEALAALLAASPPLDAFEAAALGRTARLQELLAQDPTRAKAHSGDGFTALHLASYFGHLEGVRTLLAYLDYGVDTNAVARNPTQVQPLHSAAAGGHREIMELLLAHGAAVNARQQGGWTALHAAAQRGDLEMARLLLSHGADTAQASDDGLVPSDRLPDQSGAEIRTLLAVGRAE